MAQRGEHFTTGAPRTAGAPIQGFSSWGKGLLLGLFLMAAGLLLAGIAAPRDCGAGVGAINYFSLNVGNVSVFIRWSPFGCR